MTIFPRFLFGFLAVSSLGLTGCEHATVMADPGEATEPTFAAIAPETESDVKQQPGRIGQQIDEFTLRDFRGKSHSLTDWKADQLLVVVFLGTECPLAKLYMPSLSAMATELKPSGVGFVGINSNSQDSITEIANHARVHKLPFPVLKDAGNHIADHFGAKRTPEVFVLDAKRRIQYRGRIDDRYGVGYIREEPTREDLREAIKELLAGKPVSEPQTEVVGCLIGRVAEPNPDSRVTYSNQIARLFQTRCVECHRKGEIAPFTLDDYEEAAGWGEMIAEVVRENRMPPWHADPKHGEFANDRHLNDAEKELIYEWVRNGAPEGDPADLPEPPKFPSGWNLPREPDLVLEMRDEPFDVPADGTVKYKYFRVDPGFTEDKWISAAEVVPGNRQVVHHILVLVRDSRGRVGSVFRSGFFAAYVPGLRPVPLPKGMAKRIPAGSELIFQVHYTPIGTPQTDLSKVGIVFADPEEIDHQVVTTQAATRRLRIPPHAENHRVEATYRPLQADGLLLGMSPHMHLRGKSFSYEAIYPDGKREMLLDVPAYDFNWQTSYRLAEPKPLPKGTRIHCVAHFDNSTDNPANPDPEATVRWGDQTWNEMMIGYFDVAIPIDKDDLKAADEEDPAVARAKGLLLEFDGNGDGEVTRNEVPENATPIFDRLDTDKNDKVTLKELTAGVRFMMRRSSR